MRAVEMDFFPREETRGEEYEQFDAQLDDFIGALQRDGNLLRDSDVTLELADRVQVRAIAAADDALRPTNWNFYALKNWEKLSQMSNQEPQLRLVEETDDGDAACACVASGALVLYSTYSNRVSPIDCLDCALPVPLYRLPHLKEEQEHWTLSSWGQSYQTLDQLYMDSWWGERMAYHQLSNPRAGFIKHSCEIARELEEKVGKPVYVFRLHAYKEWDETCPLCKREWVWHNTPRSLFHFKCDGCRLISQEAGSEAQPLSELHP